jgi:hypothetical protein
MAMYAATMRRQRGVLLGEPSLIAEADARMSAEGIRVPERIATLFAPGFVNAR